jgi:hypothetical protein
MGVGGTDSEKSADGAEISVSAPALKIHESRQDDVKRGVHRRMQLEQDRQATRINTCIGALVHIVGCAF